MFLIGKQWFGSAWPGLLLALYYGFTTAALNSTIYLRMYGLLAMFTTILVYLHIRVYCKKGQKIKIELLLIALTTILGGMTHYYFLVLAFFMTIFWGIWLCLQKRWKVFFIYSGMMAISAAIVVMAFPVILSYLHLGGSGNAGNSISYDTYGWKITQSLNYVLSNVTGFYLPNAKVWLVIFIIGIVCLVILGLPTLVLSRRNHNPLKDSFKGLIDMLRRRNWCIVLLMAAGISSIAVVAKISDIHTMGIYANRYFFYLMPIGAIFICCFLEKIFRWIFKSRKIQTGMLICALVICAYNSYRIHQCDYLFKYNSNTGVNAAQLTENANCIYIAAASSNLVTIGAEILNCKQFFESTANDFDADKQALETLQDAETPMYLLIEKNALSSKLDDDETGNIQGDTTVLDKISALSIVTKQEYIDTIDTFEGEIDIYRLN